MNIKLFFVSCFLTASLLKAQIITTIAGTGAAGYSGDGGPATAAKLQDPWSLAIDASGNLYINSYNDYVIRKISPSGIISTVAGNGIAGYNGDGGQATNASLGPIFGIAVDATGNLYIADDSNNVIRKVNTAGIIGTVVGNGTTGYSGDGGQATAAVLNSPNGINFDSQGNLYIADGSNHAIRMVNTAGVITTVAGNGFGGYGGDGGQATATELNNPTNVITDASGNIYIADQSNQRIRRVDKITGIITSIAGSGATGPWNGSFTGDGGQATTATLSLPTDLKFDAQGNLFIVDLYTNHVRKVNTAGVISTVVGSGVYGYFGDGGLATSADLRYPAGLAIDPVGNLYIADQMNNRIRKVGLSTTTIPDPNFQANYKIVCLGTPVTFSDSTTNTVVTSFQWDFPGGSLVSGYTLTDASPKVMYNTPGMYAVTYTATNSVGQASITKTSYINVQTTAATYNSPFSEGFETTSIPSIDWSVSNLAHSNWMLTSTAAATGLKSAMINNLANTTNNTSTIVSPTFNLAAINSPVLSFDMAYKQIATTNTDKLQVLVSTDCGASWQPKWARNGIALQPASVSGQSASPFIPSAAEFTTYTVNINSVASNTNVMCKWAFTSGTSSVGNNIYLDNINIYDATSLGIKKLDSDFDLTVYPNPSSGSVNVVLNLNEKHNVAINLVDVIGRVVETTSSQPYSVGESTITIGNKAIYQPGIYFINIDLDGKHLSKKIIIQ